MVSSPVSLRQQPTQRRDRDAQVPLAAAHQGHRFDEGCTVAETARRLAISRATFYRLLDVLVGRGLEELPRVTEGKRVFSARSIERVLHGTSVREFGGRR